MSIAPTAKQSQIVADTPTDWSQTVTFAQFDPAQGSLLGIDVGLTADITGNVAIESMEAAPSTVSVSLPGSVIAVGLNQLLAGVTLMPTASAGLAAYDGSTDFAGTSGTDLAGILNAGSVETAFQTGTAGAIDLAGFIGTGTVAMTLGAHVALHVDGPANMLIDSHASAGATATLQYVTGSAVSGTTSGVITENGGVFNGGFPFNFSDAITTAPQTFDFADRTTGWQDSLAVQRFDPSLGTLLAVDIDLSGDLAASVSLENRDTAAANVSTGQTATFSLGLPGTIETMAASFGDSALLGAGDGVADFAGTGGRIDQGTTQVATFSQIADPAGLAAFTGTGSLAVPITTSGTASLDGPANLLAKLAAAAGATVSVRYVYAAPPPVAFSLATAATTISGPITITGGQTLTTTDLLISDALTVSGAGSKVDNTGSFVVGAGTFGSLLVVAGGLVQTSAGTAAIAGGAGADGANATVSGKGSSWQVSTTLDVGDGAAGSLSISAGGSVAAGGLDIGVLAGGPGIVSVVGVGSSLSAGGSLTIGDAASAELSILNGATVSAQNADIGLGATATGNVDIEGAGSHLNIANNLNIGDAGTGVLTLGSNTELTVVNALNVGANGVLNQFGGLIDPAVINNTGRVGGKGAIIATTSILNTGTLFASGGTETLTSPIITGAGALEIDAGGNLVLNVGSVAATQTATFTDGTGVLTIGTLAGFAATISDFLAGDTIVVLDPAFASQSFDAATHRLTVFDAADAAIGTLQFGATVTNASVTGPPPCFAAGTRIGTERGEIAVEDLRVGDQVQLALGGAAPIVWLGHRAVDCTRHPEPRNVWPVRVAAHALGRNRPARELFLSPDHALYVNEVLIPVKHLINNSTITQVPVDEVTYYHVELPRHAVLLAEGLAAESYLDTGDRSNFANAEGPIALYPDFSTRVWEAEGCAKLVVTGAELEAARRWVNGLAAQGNRVTQPQCGLRVADRAYG